MGREVKRVPLDFDWPLGKVWAGYVSGDCEDPPSGEGWQVWETVSEGSPVSVVKASSEELADWLFLHGEMGKGGNRYTKEVWLKFIKVGWAPSLVMDSRGIRSGVEDAAEWQK